MLYFNDFGGFGHYARARETSGALFLPHPQPCAASFMILDIGGVLAWFQDDNPDPGQPLFDEYMRFE